MGEVLERDALFRKLRAKPANKVSTAGPERTRSRRKAGCDVVHTPPGRSRSLLSP